MRLLSKNLTADKRLHLGGLLARGVLAFAIALSLSSVAWCQTTSTVDVSAGFTMNTVGPEAYGVDTAVYDGYLTATGVSTLLTQAGIGAIRYPGGSYADIFNFISGTDQTVQPGGYMASNTTFNLWMSDLVIPEGGHPIITVNYGSNLTNNSGGEPSVAASWVQYANVTNNYNIVYWEIGNEVYGNGYYSTGLDWEYDLHDLDQTAADRVGNAALSPTAYGTNAAAFVTAMKAVDPSIKVGVFLNASNYYIDWDQDVLTALSSALAGTGYTIDFVDLHFYPYGSDANFFEMLYSPTAGCCNWSGIPNIVAEERANIASYYTLSNASQLQILVTETGAGVVGGIFPALWAADDDLTWIENGAVNVEYQELHNGFLSSASPGVPEGPWYGTQFASDLARPGDSMVYATSSNPLLRAHAVRRTDGNLAVILFNEDPSNNTTASVDVSNGTLSSSGTEYSFGNANFTAGAVSPNTGIATSTVSGLGNTFTVTVPAYSMVGLLIPATGISTAPAFMVAPTEHTVSIAQGSSGTDGIQITGANGFAGTVTFAAAGLPGGVTAKFGAASKSGSVVVTLTSTAAAVPGTYPLTITGTSGSLTASFPLTLYIDSSSCNIVYTIEPQSTTGFGADIYIENSGSTTLTNWTLTWAFANGQTITSIWDNGTETQTGANVTVTAPSYSNTIAPGGSFDQLGFNGTWNGSNNNIPASFQLNGVPCNSNGAPASGAYGLAPSSAALSVAPGGSATDTITVDSNGFGGSVTLAVTGLPSGVTVAIGTNPATATSVLTFTASSTATAGTTTVTVTGTSGSLVATTTIALTVGSGTPGTGSFTLKPSAATLSIAQSASGTDTITVTDVSPFTGAVTLAATGLPTGVTAAFGTNPTTGSSVLTFTASSTATAGSAAVTITGTSGTLTATTTIALTVVANTGSFTLKPSAATLSIAQSASGTDTITVTDVSPFTGSVTLAALGLPTGVTAAFATNPTTSTSVLTLTVASTAAAATTTIAITGTSGSLTATTTVALTVTAAASFTIKPSAAALSIAQSASGTDTITVTDVNGFTGSVTLAASGLPTGVTAAFATNPATSTSVLTLTASSTATAGAATVTITGTSRTLTATTTIALTITSAGSFTLKPSAANLSVTQGATATDTITVADVSPFTGSVTLTATGLPDGVTVAYGTNPTTSTGVLTFTASRTATTGAATVTITGTSGTLTETTTIALTVVPVTSTVKCTVDYTITPQNTSAFGASITIDNTGTTAWTSWTLTWAFANGQTVSSLWNGIETQSGANVTVKNESYNGSVAAGGSLTGVGFNGTWNGTTNAVPTAFSINGTACTVN